MVQYKKLCNRNTYVNAMGALKRNGLVLPRKAQVFTEKGNKFIIEKRIKFTKQKIGKEYCKQKYQHIQSLGDFFKA